MRKEHPGQPGTRLVLEKITSSVIRNLLPAQRLAYVRRRWSEPEGRLGPHFRAIAFIDGWRNFRDQFATRF